MKWAAWAAALVVVANGVVLLSARREHSAPATSVTIELCATNLLGGGASDVPPAIRLSLATDSVPAIPGLDSAGLTALGFPATTVRAAGRLRDSTFHWPRTRPAWVRIGQRGDSLGGFTPLEVSPRRDALAPDTTSLIVRGLISFREQPVTTLPSAPAPGAAHEHGTSPDGGYRGRLMPVVSEVIPALLHLDRAQVGRLRAALPESAGCGTRQRVVIANGRDGGIWVREVP